MPNLPDYKIVEKLSGDLLEASIMPYSLSISAQKDLVRMYQVDREEGLAEFIRVNKPAQTTSRKILKTTSKRPRISGPIRIPGRPRS